MVLCGCVRSAIVRAGIFAKTGVLTSNIGRRLYVDCSRFSYTRNIEFCTRGRMMVDSASTTKGRPILDMLPEKDHDDGYVSGGWKR